MGKFTIKHTNLSEDFIEFFFKCAFLYEKNIFNIKIRWSIHLISMKGLVVYILKKYKNKIIYIKYNHASSNIF
jgi:hypothetical protein